MLACLISRIISDLNDSANQSFVVSYIFSSSASGFDQDCAILKYNLSLKWWKYDTRKRRQCFMWLGFCLFLVLVIAAVLTFVSKLTGGIEGNEADKFKEPFARNRNIVILYLRWT